MNKSVIDLHMHSYYSDDGEFSPEYLVKLCKEEGIKIMAVADHNCARANEGAKKAAMASGISYIPAIEIDCVFEGINLHVLGYGIDYKSKDFAEIEENMVKQELEASEVMLSLTRKLGFDITRAHMEAAARKNFRKDTWTGELFAEVLLGLPEFASHPLLAPYRLDGSRGDNPFVNFYWDYYSQGKPCYVPMAYPDLSQVITIVHENKGHPVLAHPAMNLKDHPVLLESVLLSGIDGVEAFSSYHSKDQASYYEKQAKDHGLIVTCGSDYHGKTKPSIHLGRHGCQTEDELMAREVMKLLE